ncbi:hypothetical protein GJ744_001649 [Endocarpon pusillum]|uniref:Uncharacterized protein n=1 Tax=Endocarpon pusillum TaxID=364733 RepID=A0A8H7E361_9EURO|nr:hypothetical protein GJ744_001649 [Endocarpon pusillum]
MSILYQSQAISPSQQNTPFPTPAYLEFAQMVRSLSTEDSVVTIFTNGLPDDPPGVPQALNSGTFGYKVESQHIWKPRFFSEGLNLALDDGKEMYMRLLVHRPQSAPAGSDLIASLSLEMVDSPIRSNDEAK